MKKKIGVILLLVVTSSNAAAAWINVGGNDIYTAYADPATIRKFRNKTTMRNLADFKIVQASDSGHT